MCKRILILLAATLMATACAHGVKQTPAPFSQVPNLDIPADLLTGQVQALPQPANGSRSELLTNHVEVARRYHVMGIDFASLVCAITGQQGITVNGARPMRPTWCDDVLRERAQRASQPVDKSVEGPVDKSRVLP